MKQRVFHPSLAERLLVAMILSVTVCLTAQGQTWTQYDQGTPPQHAAGVSSLGSYHSADLGTVNLSNGALNIKLPMGTVGGRGFGIPITLNFSSKVWSTAHDDVFNPNPPWEREVGMVYARYAAGDQTFDLFNRVAPGWTISGTPLLRKQFMGLSNCVQGHYVHNLTKLTVILPDKGEIELRDDQTDGAPIHVGCVPNVEYRGSRWHTTDGSGAIFISDVDNGVVTGNLTGTLVTADGTRYRFETVSGGLIDGIARCVSIIDHNGNRISINRYVDPGNPNHITTDYVDQLGRTVKVEQNAVDPANPSVTLALLVTIKGYQNSTQYVKVKTDLLGNHIRSDFNYNGLPIITGNNDRFGICFEGGQPPPSNKLFPGSYCERQQRIDNRKQVTEVILPDGRSLRFKYNLYGEVAEALLPTGGKLQYDYGTAADIPAGDSLFFEVAGQFNRIDGIDRVIRERRTYPDGSTLEGSWTYTYAPQLVGGASFACAEVKGYSGSSSGGTLLLRQRHFFLQASRFLTGNVAGGAFGTGYSLWSTGVEWRTETLDAAGNVINAVEQDWAQRAPVSWTTGYTQEQPANDNRVSQARKYLDNGSFAQTEMFYDDDPQRQRANNVVEVKEYDFGQSAPARRTVTSYLKHNPDNANIDYTADAVYLISLPAQQSVYEGGIEKARTVYQYDKYADDGDNAALTDYGPSVTGHDAAYGPGNTTRGNATAVGRWLDTNGATIFTYLRYDTLGNVVSTKDPRGNVATISYADNFGAGDNPESGLGGDFGPTFALPTLITSPPPNPGGQQHTAKSQYDFSAGLLTGFKDRNGVITKTEYNDPFNRPTKVINAKGVTGIETQTAMYYAPQSNPYGITLANNDVLTAKDLNATGDGILRSWTVTDGYGRTIESWTRHPQGDVKVTTIYDGFGRVIQTSNPHRNGETPVYTTTTYDPAGRVTAVTTPDGATVSTTYSGNQVTVTDQAGKSRRSEADALGRLIKVTEDPGNLNHDTYYSYDALDNLRVVTQGSQTRTFVYDSLSRLTSATNPESGTLTYAYDPNGNLIEKTDDRGVRTTMIYDALNRIKSKVYSGITSEGTAVANVTPPVHYFCDDYATLPSGAPKWPGTPSKGRLIGVTYGPGSEGTYYKYDAAGRIATNHQRQGTSNYVTTYFYNRAGAVTREERGSPARRKSWMSYDAVGRLLAMQTGIYNAIGFEPRDLVRDISYTPFGGLQSETYGNSLIHSMGYNNRLQPTEIRLGGPGNPESVFTIYSIYGTAYNVNGQDAEIAAAHNNGNIARIKYSVSGTVQYTQTFQYDQLNRLRYAVEHNNGVYNDGARAWYQTFDYDSHGNRGIKVENTSDNVDAANNALQLAEFSGANNRITRLGYAYDAAGNLTEEPGKSYTYNAENRIVTATVAGVGTSQYFYNGNGSRVKKIVGGVGTRFEYGAGGELIAEWNDADSGRVVQKDYFYKGGELLATTKAGTSGEYQYATADHLGTPRAWTDKDGNLIAGGRHDYLPFGEELFAGVGIRSASLGYGDDSTRQKFTGKERDDETGLDYFHARYYASIQGRFTSPDEFNPILGKQGADNKEAAEREFRQYLMQPAGWNRYVYALNNPCRYVDPDGMDPITVNLNIIYSEGSNYTKEEKKKIQETFIEKVKGDFGKIDIKFNITETTGTATNLGDVTRQAVATGAKEGAINVFFTKGRVGPSTEVTYPTSGTIFINTTRGAPEDLTHGVIHALGIAGGLNGYKDAGPGILGNIWAAITPGYAEYHDFNMQTYMEYLGHPRHRYSYDKPLIRSEQPTADQSRALSVLRQGALKYAQKHGRSRDY